MSGTWPGLQLDLDGREHARQGAPEPACGPERLFDAPPTMPGQMALPAPLSRADLRAVPCPTCKAKIGSPCRRPSGHTVFGGDVHAGRRKNAEGLPIKGT